MYAQSSRAASIHITQIPSAHVAANTVCNTLAYPRRVITHVNMCATTGIILYTCLKDRIMARQHVMCSYVCYNI